MQQITWNASADAKAFRAITGTMPITLDNNPKATAATDNNKRKREDNNPKAEKEAKIKKYPTGQKKLQQH